MIIDDSSLRIDFVLRNLYYWIIIFIIVFNASVLFLNWLVSFLAQKISEKNISSFRVAKFLGLMMPAIINIVALSIVFLVAAKDVWLNDYFGARRFNLIACFYFAVLIVLQGYIIYRTEKNPINNLNKYIIFLLINLLPFVIILASTYGTYVMWG